MQWSGSPPPDPTNWDKITYTYDPAGRRITKKVDGYPTRYVYAETHASNRRDGGHVIAEYSDSSLLRKYIYGPRKGWQPQASPEKLVPEKAGSGSSLGMDEKQRGRQ
ncbi:MAG: hypothetical protein ACETWQ_02675 [Phycisphaerae bacterium]